MSLWNAIYLITILLFGCDRRRPDGKQQSGGRFVAPLATGAMTSPPSCSGITITNAEFQECHIPPRFSGYPDCYSYSLMADTSDSDVVGCAPGVFYLDITSHLYQLRLEVDVRVESDPCSSAKLYLRSVLIPDGRFAAKKGDHVGTLKLNDALLATLVLDGALRAQTKTTAMDGLKDGAVVCQQAKHR